MKSQNTNNKIIQSYAAIALVYGDDEGILAWSDMDPSCTCLFIIYTEQLTINSVRIGT